MRNNLALPDSKLDGAEGVIIGMLSGLFTGVAAEADVAAIRNLDPRPLCIRRSRIRYTPTTAFGAAQAMGLHVHKIYGFTAVHTGGTPKSIQAQHYYQGGIAGSTVGDRIPLTSISCVMASTGALSTATYTAPDADEPVQMEGTGGQVLPYISGDWEPVDGLPLVLEQNTGLLLQTTLAMGASGVGRVGWFVDAYRLG